MVTQPTDFVRIVFSLVPLKLTGRVAKGTQLFLVACWLACLLTASLVHLGDRSVWTVVCAAARRVLQIATCSQLHHNVLTPGQPVVALTFYGQAAGRADTRISMLDSLRALCCLLPHSSPQPVCCLPHRSPQPVCCLLPHSSPQPVCCLLPHISPQPVCCLLPHSSPQPVCCLLPHISPQPVCCLLPHISPQPVCCLLLHSSSQPVCCLLPHSSPHPVCCHLPHSSSQPVCCLLPHSSSQPVCCLLPHSSSQPRQSVVFYHTAPHSQSVVFYHTAPHSQSVVFYQLAMWLLFLLSMFSVAADIALSLCDWKDTVTVNKCSCGFSNTAHSTQHIVSV